MPVSINLMNGVERWVIFSIITGIGESAKKFTKIDSSSDVDVDTVVGEVNKYRNRLVIYLSH